MVIFVAMKARIKFPYGVSNIEVAITEGYVFVDKTPYLELLEQSELFVAYLRPRKIGKSLFLSILEYYYDVRHKDKFQKIFSKTYIGQNPTPLASSFRVLKFDFSGIDTYSQASTKSGFVQKIKKALQSFMHLHRDFDEKIVANILTETEPSTLINAFFEACHAHSTPIYLLIDEYDHFTNEILWRDVAEFKDSVSQNGYVRKFYENIKIATQTGVVNRFFITGVSPITMDSLTSGFNIVTHLTHFAEYHDMIGFTESEVGILLDMILEDTNRKTEIIELMRGWYNGYKFHIDTPNTVYNSNMTLFFLREFAKNQQYPKLMLDPNIMPDYGKLKQMFEVANYTRNLEVLETVLYTGEVGGQLTYQFSFETDFDEDDFISLLYYLGNLTIKGEGNFGLGTIFKIPNYAIEELYWQYYAYILKKRNEFQYDEGIIKRTQEQLAGGKVEPYLRLVEKNLQALSNRDFQKFDEKYVKLLMLMYAIQGNAFYVLTERETSGGGYVDLEIFTRPSNTHRHAQYVFEVKYIKKGDESTLPAVRQEATTQLQKYLQTDTLLQTKKDLQAFIVIFVKDCLVWESVLPPTEP